MIVCEEDDLRCRRNRRARIPAPGRRAAPKNTRRDEIIALRARSPMGCSMAHRVVTPALALRFGAYAQSPRCARFGVGPTLGTLSSAARARGKVMRGHPLAEDDAGVG